MASKFGMAGGIPERRVRPIWDAVDSRQFKHALKLSTALLSKYPNSPYALALKSLILERMGKPDEALSICLNAKEQLYCDNVVHIDDLTLSTLQIVFQRLDRLDLATSCYEYACSKFPNNLELMMGLFNCYVREYSFVKQQQTAIKMYKLVGEERFLLWAVCSIQLQVFCGDGGGKLLVLAEGLLKKHVASHSLHEPEALLVYISVLEQQAKYGAANEILSGKLGSLLSIEVDRLRMQGRLLARACDYSAAAEIFQKVLESCPDDWECFLHYLGCLLEDDSSWCSGSINDIIHPPKSVDCKLFHLTDEVFDLRISQASCLVQKLQVQVGYDSIRGLHLANLEIERRKHLYGKGDNAKLIEALSMYFCRFGHLPNFTFDVEIFLKVLNHDEKMELLEKLKQSCDSSLISPTRTLGQSITIFKIQELIRNIFNSPLAELEGTAVSMTEIYCKNLPLSKNLDPQENMNGEELLSMACNVLVQLFWRTRNLGYLLEAIMVLEFGLTIRRNMWQYKILLLHLYSHLSALRLAYEWYKTLEIKNILLETISHHILPQMLVSPLWNELTDLLKDYLKFMDDHFRESADLTFLAYRHRNYSKVIEFVQFKERLQHSYQYLMVRVEYPILQLKQKADNIEEEECILEGMNSGIQSLDLSNRDGCKSLTFNEDMQSRPWWTPTPDKNYLLGPFEGGFFAFRENMQEQIKEREANAWKVLERRSLLPRLIYLSIQCASSLLKDNLDAIGSISDTNSSLELKCLLERCAKSLGHSFTGAVDRIVEVSNGQHCFEAFSLDVVEWMNFAVFLHAWNLSSQELEVLVGERSLPSSWHLVNNLVQKYILEGLRMMQPVRKSPGVDLPILVQMVTEPLTWYSLVIQSCVRSMLPSGKKKKKSGPADQVNSPMCQAIHSSILSLHDAIQEVTTWLKEQIHRQEDENLDTLLSPLQRKGLGEGPGLVFQILESLASSAGNLEVGDRICQALQSWSPVDVARKIITGQCTVLSEFLKICESKLKLLEALKQQI
ncbi:PREDICTED: phagocyte signaling-impaired protein isoform X2 [Nelumbo nucifera]|uniref:Phagocyte signaling-impaired protein isoform X2 n=1 Tax=Nelumbo nucifera TaxID=4432 RepID=A0A1U7ZTX5_NELNU|nr:PREDICTED: phagocyte signaling-impaired protein isoform X2 [Nelumbo nucifera]